MYTVFAGHREYFERFKLTSMGLNHRLDDQNHFLDPTTAIGSVANTFDVVGRLPKLEKVTDNNEIDPVFPVCADGLQEFSQGEAYATGS